MASTAPPAPFDIDELQRYSRHFTLPDVGQEGQARLKRASVVLVGAGGLGSPLGLYLAAAGVGRLTIVDGDRVDLSNLHRQVLHGTSDVGRPKVASARDRLTEINPHVTVDPVEARLTSHNALEVLDGHDIVVDGSDNFPTRYLVNDACVLLGIPNVYGSVHRFEGQASVFADTNGPCYRCLFREPPPPGLVPSCAEAGVFGILPGLVGMIQAAETIKLLLGVGEPLVGRLLLIDVLRMQMRSINLRRDPQCPACGTHEIQELMDYEAFCDPRAHATAENTTEVEPVALAKELRGATPPFVLDVREPFEDRIAHFAGAMLVPLGQLRGAVDQLPRDRQIVTLCHHGVRSAQAARFLRENGFAHVRNLVGGIDRWSAEVDSSVAQY